MSEYIEDRIKRLETRLSTQAIDITAQQFSTKELEERVKALEEKLPTPISVGTPFKFGGTIDREKFSGLMDGDHTDQSTEEFVRVVRCKECKWADPMFGICKNPSVVWCETKVEPNDYCSRGEKR